MAKKKQLADIPPLVRSAVVEKIAELQRRELDFGWEITHPYEEYLLDWRTRIERFFLSTFVTSLKPGPQTWDLVTAQQAGFADDVLDPMLDGLDELTKEVTEVAEEREREAFLLGALYGRWQLALGGVEDPDIPWPVWVAGIAAIDGLGFAPRAASWASVYRTKLGQLFATAQATGQTLVDTMFGFDALVTGLTNRIGQLARNEWYLSTTTGERAAVAPFQAQVGELWLIKDDNACLICKELHLTVTAKTPIKDTHPSCRCIKVPIVKNFSPTPVSFAAFADRHAYRPSTS